MLEQCKLGDALHLLQWDLYILALPVSRTNTRPMRSRTVRDNKGTYTTFYQPSARRDAFRSLARVVERYSLI